MRPANLEVIGDELAIRWEDGREGYVRLEALRRLCPCAGCQGEVDALGQHHVGPPVTLTPSSFRLIRFAWVGGYAVQPVWGDGHDTGLYTFDYLERLAAAEADAQR